MEQQCSLQAVGDTSRELGAGGTRAARGFRAPAVFVHFTPHARRAPSLYLLHQSHCYIGGQAAVPSTGCSALPIDAQRVRTNCLGAAVHFRPPPTQTAPTPAGASCPTSAPTMGDENFFFEGVECVAAPRARPACARLSAFPPRPPAGALRRGARSLATRPRLLPLALCPPAQEGAGDGLYARGRRQLRGGGARAARPLARALPTSLRLPPPPPRALASTRPREARAAAVTPSTRIALARGRTSESARPAARGARGCESVLKRTGRPTETALTSV
jgi:hypothetical protein